MKSIKSTFFVLVVFLTSGTYYCFAQDTIVEATIIGAEDIEADKSYNSGTQQFQAELFSYSLYCK